MNYSNFIQPYEDETMISSEVLIERIKVWRRIELTSCDWTQLSDVNLANKWDWAVYRQALRDMPQQDSDPKLWIFPTRPA